MLLAHFSLAVSEILVLVGGAIPPPLSSLLRCNVFRKTVEKTGVHLKTANTITMVIVRYYGVSDD